MEKTAQFIAQNWEVLFGGLGTAIIAAILTWVVGKRKSPSEDKAKSNSQSDDRDFESVESTDAGLVTKGTTSGSGFRVRNFTIFGFGKTKITTKRTPSVRRDDDA